MSLTIQEVAAICQEACRAYSATKGDFSIYKWNDMTERQKNGACFTIISLLRKENINKSMEEIHEKWVDFKKKDGWSYGDIYDREKKISPYCIPYKDLPDEQKFIDMFFKSLLELGIEIVRSNTEGTNP